MSDLQEEQLGDKENDLQQTLSEESADFAVEPPRRPQMGRGTLLLLGLAVAGLGGTYFMYLRSGPQRADASTVAQAKAADQAIHSFLNGGADGRRMMEHLLHNTQQVVQRFLSYPSATQVPLKDLKGNPFRQLPVAAVAGRQQQISRLEEQRKQEQARAVMLKSARTLKLQSVFLGTNLKTCVINNTLCREGQRVGDFTVEAIQSGAVILRSGQDRFELKMGE
jgi:hypothetical protein